jgi:hypothetical protein
VKKVVLNISDLTWEKLKFEAIHKKKGISEVLQDRIQAPFHKDVEEAYDSWMSKEISKICEETDAPNTMFKMRD